MAGLAICSIVRCLRTSVNGLNSGSMPSYFRMSGVEELDVVCEKVIVLSELQVEGLLENLQVLAYVTILRLRLDLLQVCENILEFLALGYLAGARCIRYQGIVLHQPLLRGPLGQVLHMHIEEHLGVLVAADNPCRLSRRNRSGRLCSRSRGRCGRSRGGRYCSSRSLRSTGRVRGHQASGENHQRNGGAVHRQISRDGNTTSIRPKR